VADLYRSRWSIEVFFKQIKQTLKLVEFLGHSDNAVRCCATFSCVFRRIFRDGQAVSPGSSR
jgi:IS4 transposase